MSLRKKIKKIYSLTDDRKSTRNTNYFDTLVLVRYRLHISEKTDRRRGKSCWAQSVS